MSQLNKLIDLWKYYGTINFLNKAWENAVINPKRFRTGINRQVPNFDIDVKSGEMMWSNSLKKSKKIKILYLIHCFYPDKQGGTERFLLNLAHEQQRCGNQVKIISMGTRTLNEYQPYSEGIYTRQYQYQELAVVEFRYKKAPRGMQYKNIDCENKELVAFAEKMLKEENPDIVHCVYPQPFSSFLNICNEKRIPYILTLTDFNILCHYATMVDKYGQLCASSQEGEHCRKQCNTFLIKDFRKRYEAASKVLKDAGCITAPSKFVAEVINQEFQDIAVQVVPHGISEAFFSNIKRNHVKRVAYVGTLSELKGVHLLINAFKKTDKLEQLTLYGGGNPVYLSKLKKMAEGDRRIKFEGKIDPELIPDIYRENDCIVIPSLWYETYNFVLREALASHCIVIASKIGAMPEIIIEDINGYMFNIGNLAELKTCLEKAAQFKWQNYKEVTIPTIVQEAKVYEGIYNRFGNLERNFNA